MTTKLERLKQYKLNSHSLEAKGPDLRQWQGHAPSEDQQDSLQSVFMHDSDKQNFKFFSQILILGSDSLIEAVIIFICIVLRGET